MFWCNFWVLAVFLQRGDFLKLEHVLRPKSLSVHVDWHLRGVISTVVSRREGVVHGSQNGIIVETDSKQYNVICFFGCT